MPEVVEEAAPSSALEPFLADTRTVAVERILPDSIADMDSRRGIAVEDAYKLHRVAGKGERKDSHKHMGYMGVPNLAVEIADHHAGVDTQFQVAVREWNATDAEA